MQDLSHQILQQQVDMVQLYGSYEDQTYASLRLNQDGQIFFGGQKM